MANIREQCSWVHPEGTLTTQKAMQLVSSAVAKANRLEPLQIRRVPVIPAALVVGGGIAGIHAALDIADAGFEVTLVEKSPTLGGQAAKLQRTFPTLEPVADFLTPLIERTLTHPRISVLTEAEVVEVGGYVGNFHARIRQGEDNHEVPAGAIIVATGYQTFDAQRKPELGYGVYPQVITTLDFERLSAGPIKLTVRNRRKLFIQCVGSRTEPWGILIGLASVVGSLPSRPIRFENVCLDRTSLFSIWMCALLGKVSRNFTTPPVKRV
jgi:heterodisulfide reductase subunit A-like polyferredoxin